MPTPPAARVEIFYGKPLVRTPEAMIEDLGLEIFSEDKVQIFPDPQFGLGSQITVTRAIPVWIDDGGEKTLVRTFQETIEGLLNEKGIVMGALDRIEPAIETGILWEGTIAITRVEETQVVEKKSIAFQTVTKDDPNLFKGTTRVEQAGKSGTKELTYRVRRENGQEVHRELLGEKVVAEPVDKIVIRGTKVQVAYGPWAEMINEIAPQYGADPAGMTKIMNCESGGNARAYSAAGPYYGLFQFHMTTFTRMGYSSDQIYDPASQIEAAARLWNSRYHHWPVCSRGT